MDDLPPLAGIPFSVKDNIFLKGTTSTFGLMKRCNTTDDKDSPVVKALKMAGGIPFVKSSTS